MLCVYSKKYRFNPSSIIKILYAKSVKSFLFVKMLSPPVKTRWICRQCTKSLCSKRSYDEHMNIHKNVRPFVCEDCDYAAASQMTLMRHRQRRHTPRNEWHYQCPYCVETYMEPASYRQHVLARHYGHSATFGCPYGDCPFKCKSSKAFRDHLLKHQAVIFSRTNGGQAQRMQYDMENLVLYMVDDECGIGDMSTISHKFAILYDRTTGSSSSFADCAVTERTCLQQIQPIQPQQQQHRRLPTTGGNNANNQSRKQQHTDCVMRINVDELLQDDEEEIDAQQNRTNAGRKEKPKLRHKNGREAGRTVEEKKCFGRFQQQPTDWFIEAEVVIGETTGQQQMPDGQTDDFGLD